MAHRLWLPLTLKVEWYSFSLFFFILLSSILFVPCRHCEAKISIELFFELFFELFTSEISIAEMHFPVFFIIQFLFADINLQFNLSNICTIALSHLEYFIYQNKRFCVVTNLHFFVVCFAFMLWSLSALTSLAVQVNNLRYKPNEITKSLWLLSF